MIVPLIYKNITINFDSADKLDPLAFNNLYLFFLRFLKSLCSYRVVQDFGIVIDMFRKFGNIKTSLHCMNEIKLGEKLFK